MAEVNKEELRRLAEVLFESENDDAFDAWEEATHPWKILPLLDENAAQADRIAEFERECERLRGKLLEAAGCIGEWGAYASEYFQEKHNLAGDIAEFQAAAMQEGGV